MAAGIKVLASVAFLQEGVKIGQELLHMWKKFVNDSPSESDEQFVQHNMYIGEPQSDDVVFFNYFRDVPAKLLQRRSEVISWSGKELGKDRIGIITSVSVIDCCADGTGGVPELLEGGVGETYVKIKFTSRFSRGYAVRVVITGLVTDI